MIMIWEYRQNAGEHCILAKFISDILGRVSFGLGLDWKWSQNVQAGRGILSCVIVGERRIKSLNAECRNQSKITDVLSFGSLEEKSGEQLWGEIFICYNVAERQAKEYGHSLEREVEILFVHGLLHLFGYDHHTARDRREMQHIEEKIVGGGLIGR
ncbi:MAG: putative rRNA maturation factor [Parcubacteria group bacterium Gr01-1014_18]|nr:MAG: putative rRNA maturation factor [Parcubacteria group bacterium Greene0416_36]TSC81292.1 MAG: putative rRNA maturation factor [Parcubacteria group bacterium Gr01-1014_18]TSC99314.1 MAG: putative rRNA maturation factor [Parcubacteria group bacterium Greene1014_20]TSD06849.1 MAG: putative rRNA maturation factor [Parcubacteria group bacterium Greene0714_2]